MLGRARVRKIENYIARKTAELAAWKEQEARKPHTLRVIGEPVISERGELVISEDGTQILAYVDVCGLRGVREGDGMRQEWIVLDRSYWRMFINPWKLHLERESGERYGLHDAKRNARYIEWANRIAEAYGAGQPVNVPACPDY